MEAQPGTGSSSSSVAYPRWVMLEKLLEIKVEDSSSCSLSDDAKTMAAARTGAGHPIQVSLRLVHPPALSRVCIRIPDVVKVEKSRVLAAHGDTVLIQVRIKQKYQQFYTVEHFVYNAGAAATYPPRPPSLSLLPQPRTDVVPKGLWHRATGLLRRGKDEFVVATELTAGTDFEISPTSVVELYVFRSGEWNFYDIEIEEDWDLPLERWDTVVPVNDRLLAWVDLHHGVLLVDVLEETPRAQCLRLPMDLRGDSESIRNVCVTAGGSALKLVNIFPRYCCDGAGASSCERSLHAYIIQTWTMRIGNGDMDWVLDSMVDATELWALDTYMALPGAPICRPIVSTDEPEVICISLREPVWPVRQIMVNMRSKTIHSVSSHEVHSVSSHEDEVGPFYKQDKLISSNVSHFFNTYPCSGSGDATLTGQRSQVDIERPPAVVVDSSNPTLRQPSTTFADPDSVHAALLEMSEALKEIPSYGLLGPDEVKAYRILVCSDNGRRLKSFLRLPKDLRKDWLLMEIKTCDSS